MSQLPLEIEFGPPITLEQFMAKDDRSYTQKVTARKRHMLARGLHPATGMPLLRKAQSRCGNCNNCVLTSNGNRHFYKCALVENSHSINTDIRLRWPACVKWEKRVGEMRDFYFRH